TLKYLLKDPHPSLTRRSSSAIVPASAKMQASEAPHRQLFVPGTGPVGTLTPIDYRRLDLRRDGGDWTLYDARTVLGRFGRQRRNLCPPSVSRDSALSLRYVHTDRERTTRQPISVRTSALNRFGRSFRSITTLRRPRSHSLGITMPQLSATVADEFIRYLEH